jgi:hypothetical protein
VQFLWAAGQRSHKPRDELSLRVCSVVGTGREATYRRGRCATKSNLGGREALAGVAAGRQGKCKRACTGLDSQRTQPSVLLRFSSLTRARQTGRWCWRQEGVRREGWRRPQVSGSRRRGRELGVGGALGGGRGPGVVGVLPTLPATLSVDAQA